MTLEGKTRKKTYNPLSYMVAFTNHYPCRIPPEGSARSGQRFPNARRAVASLKGGRHSGRHQRSRRLQREHATDETQPDDNRRPTDADEATDHQNDRSDCQLWYRSGAPGQSYRKQWPDPTVAIPAGDADRTGASRNHFVDR